jgi:LacI family transcriptional regulator
MARARKSITIQDIARRANVSVATVSNVLNGKEFVDPEIRQTVLRVAEQLNYSRPRKSSRAERGLGKMVALISADVTDPVMSLIFKGIENIARLHGYTSILCDSENSVELEREHILSLMDRGIDGMLIVPSGDDLDCLGQVRERNCPFVIVDRRIRSPEASYVGSDNLEGAFLATKYLLSLGHRRIVFLAGRSSNSTAAERYQGFRRAMEDQGLEVAEELILQGDFDWAESYRELERLIRAGVQFSAVFAANDTMALAAKEAIEKNGRRIPADVSIVGYNDVLFASAVSLTTVALDPLEMGKASVMLLLDLVHQRRTAPQQIVLPPRLIIRDSCRQMSPGDSH